MEEWRLLENGRADGPTNMAIDEAILVSHARGDVPPTLRFYGWHPHCLSIGAFQPLALEVDLQECAARGIDVVRRPTGGRAVLHASEVTYSLVTSANHHFANGNVRESYYAIGLVLAAGLRALGVDVVLAPHTIAHRQEGKRLRTAACFAATSDYEIILNGRKVVGSAQMRKGAAILQHGSILIDVDLQALRSVLRAGGRAMDSTQIDSLGKKMIGLREGLGRNVVHADVVAALVCAFSQLPSLNLLPGELSESERQLAVCLRSERYANERWTHRR